MCFILVFIFTLVFLCTIITLVISRISTDHCHSVAHKYHTDWEVWTSSYPFPAALCVMVAASIYTSQKSSFHTAGLQEGSYGSSFILAWISFPTTLISGCLYLILRKRKWGRRNGCRKGKLMMWDTGGRMGYVFPQTNPFLLLWVLTTQLTKNTNDLNHWSFN